MPARLSMAAIMRVLFALILLAIFLAAVTNL